MPDPVVVASLISPLPCVSEVGAARPPPSIPVRRRAHDRRPLFAFPRAVPQTDGPTPAGPARSFQRAARHLGYRRLCRPQRCQVTVLLGAELREDARCPEPRPTGWRSSTTPSATRRPRTPAGDGLGAQMIAWDEELCERLVERGFFVIRYDNRDIGSPPSSTTAPARPDRPAVGRRVERALPAGRHGDDAVGLLDALGIARAHIVGPPWGDDRPVDRIAHPERVLSVCSVMSTTGARDVGQPRPSHGALLVRRPTAGAGDRAVGGGFAGHFLDRLPLRRGAGPRARWRRLRPQLQPGRHGPPAGGHPGVAGPH